MDRKSLLPLLAAALLGCNDPEAEQSLRDARESGAKVWEQSKDAAAHTAAAAKKAVAALKHQVHEAADNARDAMRRPEKPPAAREETTDGERSL